MKQENANETISKAVESPLANYNRNRYLQVQLSKIGRSIRLSP